MEKSRPKIILSAAVSIDGKIATKNGESKLSSKQDLIRLHKLRSKVDAILVGKNTVIRDNPLLTVRLVKGKNPTRIILDSNGNIPENSKILKTAYQIPTIIAVSKNIPQKNLEKLEKFPIKIIFTGTKTIQLKNLLRQLSQQKIQRVLVEGGGTVNWQFIKEGLFDEMFLTITPHIIGGHKSINLIEGLGFQRISKSPKLQLKSVRRLKNDIVLNYIKM